jgi:hypothetical protein
MKIREQAMAWSIGGLVGLMILYTLLSTLLLGPLSTYRKKIAEGRSTYDKYHSLNARQFNYVKRLNNLEAMTYDANSDAAARQLRIRLLELAKASGLDESQLLMQRAEPVTEHPNNIEYFTQVGWNISCEGDLKQLTDLLYLLKSEPRLIRVDKLRVQPRDDRILKASFACNTLVLASMKGWVPVVATTQPTQPAPAPTVQLANADRIHYNGIAERDFFRPYIPRPPQPPGEPGSVNPPPPQMATPAPPGGPDYNRYRLAGLTAFGTEGELPILLVDQTEQKGQQYGVGQSILDLKIVMVDYRPLPSPQQPEVLSPSRLILQQNDEYWAVELGQTLSLKRKLESGQLPAELQTAPAAAAASAPAEAESTQDVAETEDTAPADAPDPAGQESESAAE